MKRLVVMMVMLLPLFVISQTKVLTQLELNKSPRSNILILEKSPVDKLFDKYSDKAGFKKVDISGKLFASMRSGYPASMPQFEEFYKQQFRTLLKIKGISILTVEDKNLNKSVNFYKELETEGFFNVNNYEVLMEVTGKDEMVHFYGRKIMGEDKYDELLIVIGGKENKVISIRGLIDPMEIGQVTKALDVDINKFSR